MRSRFPAAEKGLKAGDVMILDSGAETANYDHTLINEELLKLSQAKNVTLQVTLKTDLTEPAKAGQAEATPDGLAFDRAFIDQMVKDHQEAVDLFHAEADDGKDKEVKEWAEKKLPTLRRHLKLAKDLQEKISR